MKLAILGAPGAGKSDFAHDLADKLEEAGEKPFMLIDFVVEDLRRVTGLEFGGFGSHIDDMQVVFKRREEELELSFYDNGNMNTITVGTVLDSTAHCFVRAEDPAHNRKELFTSNERLRAIAETFGMLYTDTWDYDYAFYLPYKGEDPYSRLVDAALVELLTKYAAPVLSFKRGVTDDEKASTAARAITALEEKQLSEAPERGVRPSGEAGEDDGDSTESVPDVPEQGRDSHDA